MGHWIYENPWNDIDRSTTTSGITSRAVPLWDADDWTMSFRTRLASFSTTTIQFTNTDAGVPETIAEATWSNWTALGGTALGPPNSGLTWWEMPAGQRYVRFLSATTDPLIDVNKHLLR